MVSGPSLDAQGRTLCASCGDVIGVYEPMVVLTDGCARTTSIAAEGSRHGADTRLHLDCHLEAHDGALSPGGPA
jgi:hypothetical protein